MPTIRIESRVDASLQVFMETANLNKTAVYDLVRHSVDSCKTICTYLGYDGQLIFDLTRIEFYLNILETTINAHAKRHIKRAGAGTSFEPLIRARCIHFLDHSGEHSVEVLDFFFYQGNPRELETDTRLIRHDAQHITYH